MGTGMKEKPEASVASIGLVSQEDRLKLDVYYMRMNEWAPFEKWNEQQQRIARENWKHVEFLYCTGPDCWMRKTSNVFPNSCVCRLDWDFELEMANRGLDGK